LVSSDHPQGASTGQDALMRVLPHLEQVTPSEEYVAGARELVELLETRLVEQPDSSD
jgi:hypothetical protein